MFAARKSHTNNVSSCSHTFIIFVVIKKIVHHVHQQHWQNKTRTLRFCALHNWFCDFKLIGRSPPSRVKQTGVEGSLRHNFCDTGPILDQHCFLPLFKAETIVSPANAIHYSKHSTCWISAGPTSKMLVQPQPCIGPTLHQHSTNFWD